MLTSETQSKQKEKVLQKLRDMLTKYRKRYRDTGTVLLQKPGNKRKEIETILSVRSEHPNAGAIAIENERKRN